MFLTGEYEMRLLVLIVVLLMVSPAVGQQPKSINNSIGMQLVLIHAGSFTMGSPIVEVGLLPETRHEVTIGKSFYLGPPRVSRGGGWKFGAKFCRSAYRQATNPDSKTHFSDSASP